MKEGLAFVAVMAVYVASFALFINGLVWTASHGHWVRFVFSLLFPPFGALMGAVGLFN